MKVTYELDGKKVSADDLEGKSGHLKIHYEYQNTSADSENTHHFDGNRTSDGW